VTWRWAEPSGRAAAAAGLEMTLAGVIVGGALYVIGLVLPT
jgi:hypothetical protein